MVYGNIARLSPTSLEITELPIRTWTQVYKENVLELMLHGNEKNPPFIRYVFIVYIALYIVHNVHTLYVLTWMDGSSGNALYVDVTVEHACVPKKEHL